MGYNITEEKDAPDDADEWQDKEKSEQDILTWDT
jgi:ferredoxin